MLILGPIIIINLVQYDFSGDHIEFGPIEIFTTDKDNNFTPSNALLHNYPNPFNSVTTILFSTNNSDPVKIEIYDTCGQKVSTLLDIEMKAGYHEVKFNAQNLSSGIYFYRIEAGEFQDAKKMILIK